MDAVKDDRAGKVSGLVRDRKEQRNRSEVADTRMLSDAQSLVESGAATARNIRPLAL